MSARQEQTVYTCKINEKNKYLSFFMNNSCLPPTTRLTINISCENLEQQNQKID